MPPSAQAVEDALRFAARLADAARAAIRPLFRNRASVTNKRADGFDPVTAADLAAERAMRNLIAAERPEDGIEGEEFGTEPSTSGFRWVLDPIDGTRAFMAGLPVWTTLIGWVDAEDHPWVGVIDQPVVDERYLGWPEGAALESKGERVELKVSTCTDLARALIATTDPYLFDERERRAWTELRRLAPVCRYGLDAYGYARLAAGTIDLVAESGLKPYDVAALMPVVRGAGGCVLDWSGTPATVAQGRILCAATRELADAALACMTV